MSTNFNEEESPLSDWINQAEAARLHGVSRQAISKLVRTGRLKSRTIGGHVLVSRSDVESFRPNMAGRPRGDESRELERIRRLLADTRPEVRRAVFDDLRKEFAIHPLEAKLGASAEVILGSIDRASELTIRMIRGVIAEAAFEVYAVSQLEGWSNEPIQGGAPYDFVLRDAAGPVRIQVKLQRRELGKPKIRNGLFVAETQRTRNGKDRASGEKTRPYRFGEFDILAVAMQPAKGRWDVFYYAVADWLTPQKNDEHNMTYHQAVAAEPNEDWTDNYDICVGWLRSGLKKKIRWFG